MLVSGYKGYQTSYFDFLIFSNFFDIRDRQLESKSAFCTFSWKAHVVIRRLQVRLLSGSIYRMAL